MSKVIIEQNMGGVLTARNIDGGAEFRIEIASHTDVEEKQDTHLQPINPNR
jgi:hypothetical protein